MYTGILYTHILYALGGSEMPNGQNLRPITAVQLYRRSTAVRDRSRPPCAVGEHDGGENVSLSHADRSNRQSPVGSDLGRSAPGGRVRIS